MNSRITKRQFLKTGLSAAAAGLIGQRAYAQSTPNAGGSLRVASAWGSTADTLNPATAQDGGAYSVQYAIRNCLMEIDANGSVVPELASSIESSADAKQWVATVRKGVEFHDGKSLTPSDIVDTINFHRGEDSNSAVKGLVQTISDVRVDGDDKVIFDLDSGNADFPAILADPHLVILPTVDGAIDWQSGNGTGGYTLESFEPGVRVRYTKHGNYWKEGRAHLDTVEVTPIRDPVARTNALLTNAVDVIEDVVANQVDLITQRGLKVVDAPSAKNFYFGMNMRGDTPYRDVNVRLAMKHAIDREAILQSVLNGRGAIGNDNPINGTYAMYAEDLEQHLYDPDKAKFYLKQAGLDSLRVPLHASNGAFTGAVDAAVLYKEHAKQAGIEIDVVNEPADGYWSNVWGKKPFFASLWGGRPTADLMLSIAFKSDAAWNDSGWGSERFDELLIMARAELDTAKRKEMYREAQQILKDDGSTITFAFANWIFAHNEKLGRPGQVGTTFNLDGARFVERWWVT